MTNNKHRTLFIDDQDIVSVRDVRRVTHASEKYEGNPVVVADKPWEGNEVLLSGTVRKDGDRFRMWYQNNGNGTNLNLYAESSEGLKWTKPSLDRYEDFAGNRQNNIYLSRIALRSNNLAPVGTKQDHNQNVLFTPHLGQGRVYTMISYDYGRSGYGAYDGYYLASSDDGLIWTDGPNSPVIPGHADVGRFIWDEDTKMFRGIVKTFLNIRGFARRSILWTESADGFEWTMPKPALIPDLQDEAWTEGHEGYHTQFYGMPIFRYEGMLIGLLQVFRCTDGANSSDGSVDVQLAYSRDGKHWHRAEDRTTVLERGDKGTWDWGVVHTGNSLVMDGDTVRTYYTGFNCGHGNHSIPAEGKKVCIGTASWPRDRLVGLLANTRVGEVRLTQSLSGTDIHINADASRGSLVIELSKNGEPIEGFNESNCVPMKEDSLDHTIRWRNSPNLPHIQPGEIDISVKLTNSEIFSIWSE